MCAKKFMCLIINVLSENHVSLTVQFFDTTVHFLCKRIRDASIYTSKKYRSSFYS